MPFVTSPDFQRFLEQQTGVNPAESLRKALPSSLTDGGSLPTGYMVNPIGTPITHEAGANLYDWMSNKHFLKPIGNYISSLGQDSGRSAMMTALALGLGGAGFGLLIGRNPLTWGAMGAGAGGLAGYGMSELSKSLAHRKFLRAQRAMAGADWNQKRLKLNDEAAKLNEETKMGSRKQAYYGMNGQDPMAYIQSRIFADHTMAPPDKTLLLSSVQNLSPQGAMSLADLLRTAGGAAVGLLVSRFLLNMGGFGQAVFSAAGGLAGSMLGSRLPRNAFGEPVDTQHDVFGGSRYVT